MTLWKRVFGGKNPPEDGPLGALKGTLARCATGQLEKAAACKTVPRRLVNDCGRLLTAQLDDIAHKVLGAMQCGVSANHAYQDTNCGVYMVVSVFPWSTQETVKILAESSTEKPFGYVHRWTNLFINNWPSAELTHYFHVVVCKESPTCIVMHTALGDYGGFAQAQREFVLWPLDLLNEDEHRMHDSGRM